MESKKRKPGASKSEPQRLNKTIAAAGVCSRRDADELISAGRVRVNGIKIVNLSTLVDPKRDKIEVDGHQLRNQRLEYVLLNKPKGVITSCEDEKNRKCVIDLLPDELRHLKPVGRLDRESSGLILMTNDGPFIYDLTHPCKEIDKTYRVTVDGRLTKAQAEQLAVGIELEEGLTQEAQIEVLSVSPDESTFEIVIHEGRNRQIRRMCSQVGLHVSKLIRVSIGGLQLGGLKPGAWRFLSSSEVLRLKNIKKSAEHPN